MCLDTPTLTMIGVGYKCRGKAPSHSAHENVNGDITLEGNSVVTLSTLTPCDSQHPFWVHTLESRT